MSEPGASKPAAIAAGGDHRHALGFGWHLRRIDLAADEFEQDADDLVLHLAQPLGAAAAVAVLEQQLLGARAGLRERELQPLRHRGAQFALAAGMGLRQRLEIGDDRRRVDELDVDARRTLAVQHHAIAIAEPAGAVIVQCGRSWGMQRCRSRWL